MISRKLLAREFKTAKDVHNDLVKEGYELSYPHVTKILHSMDLKKNQEKRSLTLIRNKEQIDYNLPTNTRTGPLKIGIGLSSPMKHKLVF